MGSKHSKFDSFVGSFGPIPIENIDPDKSIVIIINDTSEVMKIHVSLQSSYLPPHEMSYFNTGEKRDLVVIFSVINDNEIFRKQIENNYFVKVTDEDIISVK
uniref:Uncharacterized protein n=1 Tax=Pithovirus LCPAC406 TaxID=2506599 RepID=A0A481ZEB8_9VIRU|nr:MAG: hypothetical protein LCPAC406_02900 [Pithovirus LCPAC406]